MALPCSDQDAFAVLGTRMYESKTGPRTVFELIPFKDFQKLASLDIPATGEGNDEPEFSAEEAVVVANARKENERLEAEKKAAVEHEKMAKKAAVEKTVADEKAEHNEKSAEQKFKFAEKLLKEGKSDAYRRALKDLVDKYPNTNAAERARRALK